MINWLAGIAATIISGVVLWWLTPAAPPAGSNPPTQTCVTNDSKTLLLTRPPGSWGKPIAGSSGKATYCDNVAGSLSANIELRGLSPSHTYVLILNGKPGHPSNDWLTQKHGIERYVDFAQVQTDSWGNADEEINTRLHAGDYDVSFFVKDPDDWKIVLYNDLLRFVVR